MQKIFKYLDPKDDGGLSMHLYDTAVDLAEGELEEVETRLFISFQYLFHID